MLFNAERATHIPVLANANMCHPTAGRDIQHRISVIQREYVLFSTENVLRCTEYVLSDAIIFHIMQKRFIQYQKDFIKYQEKCTNAPPINLI